MTFNYDLESPDLVVHDMRIAAREQSHGGRLVTARTLLSWALWLLLCIFIWTSGDESLSSVAAFLLVCLIAIAALERRSVKQRLARLYSAPGNAALLGARSLSLTPEGFSILSKAVESRCSWSALQEVELTVTHVFLYVARVHAFLIPLRAFSTEDAAALNREIRERVPPDRVHTVS